MAWDGINVEDEKEFKLTVKILILIACVWFGSVQLSLVFWL